MKYLKVVLALMVLTLSACGSGHSKQLQDQFKNNPHAQKDVEQLKIQANTCYKQVGLKVFRKAGRQEFIQCLVPPERQDAAKKCLDDTISKNGIPFSKSKVQLEFTIVADCLAATKGK